MPQTLITDMQLLLAPSCVMNHGDIENMAGGDLATSDPGEGDLDGMACARVPLCVERFSTRRASGSSKPLLKPNSKTSALRHR